MRAHSNASVTLKTANFLSFRVAPLNCNHGVVDSLVTFCHPEIATFNNSESMKKTVSQCTTRGQHARCRQECVSAIGVSQATDEQVRQRHVRD